MVSANFLLTMKVKVKGHGFIIYGTNHYVMMFGSYSVNRMSKHDYLESRYPTAIFKETFK